MGLCCVDGCDESSEGITYFEFPTSRGLRKRWQEAVRCPPKIPLGSVVCSRHFRPDEYEPVRGKVRLKKKIVPTLFLDNSEKSDLQTFEPLSNEEVPNNNRKTLENVQNNPDNCQKDTQNCLKDVITNEKDAQTCQKDSENPQLDIETCQKDTESCQNETLINLTELISENIEKYTEIIPDVLQKDERVEIEIKDKSRKDTKDNGTNNKDELYTENIICRVINNEYNRNSKKMSDSDPKDIEEMITNYQIKNKLPNPALLPDPEIEPAPMDSIDVENVKDPVFIEVNVDKTNGPSGGNEDCLMLLESVQVDIDPASLMLPELDSDVESVHSVEVVERKNDPISLLTSSDEDDVILQEPHIDTVEVSDETDEDDMPLVKLVKKHAKRKSQKSSKKRISKKKMSIPETVNLNPDVMFGMYEFYCVQCRFSTSNTFEYNKHINEHSTVLQVCQICNYTTASRSQFSRHSKKHKDEKKHTCHLCEYKARHKMSLVYHLQSHDGKTVDKSVKSVNKNVKSVNRSVKSVNKSIETVIIDSSPLNSEWKAKKCKKCALSLAKCVCKLMNRYSCCDCSYKTKRRSDLKRHRLRVHINSDGG